MAASRSVVRLGIPVIVLNSVGEAEVPSLGDSRGQSSSTGSPPLNTPPRRADRRIANSTSPNCSASRLLPWPLAALGASRAASL